MALSYRSSAIGPMLSAHYHWSALSASCYMQFPIGPLLSALSFQSSAIHPPLSFFCYRLLAIDPLLAALHYLCLPAGGFLNSTSYLFPGVTAVKLISCDWRRVQTPPPPTPLFFFVFFSSCSTGRKKNLFKLRVMCIHVSLAPATLVI